MESVAKVVKPNFVVRSLYLFPFSSFGEIVELFADGEYAGARWKVMIPIHHLSANENRSCT